MFVTFGWNLSKRDLMTFLIILGLGILSPRLKIKLTMALNLSWNSSKLSSCFILISPNLDTTTKVNYGDEI